MKSNIFCITGKTGSGKTKILNEIIKDSFFMDKCKIHKITYWTTRRKRKGESSTEYNFIDYGDFLRLDKSEIFESRMYETKNDGKAYWFTKNSDLTGYKNYIISCGAEQVYNYVDKLDREKYNIYIIYLETGLLTKMQRMIDHRMKNDNDALEFCRRVISEEEDFKKMDDIYKRKDHYKVKDICICSNNNDSTDLFDTMINQLKIWICYNS